MKAIEWMSTQPQALRERANSADLMVSYYLQACRKSAAKMEAPVSQENFKADLKHLVEDLKKFDEPSAPPNYSPGRSSSYGAAASIEPIFGSPAATPPPQAPQAQRTQGLSWTVDAKSLLAAREFQIKLNLSHESEALRFLITLGAERARQLFP